MNLTPWYPARIKPLRSGVYEVRWHGDGSRWRWCYWTGSEWANTGTNKAEAAARKTWTNGAVQSKSWRGLAEEPK